MTEHSPPYTSIHTLSNRFEADLLMGALEEEGVPALLRSFEETPYDGLFVSQRGWGLILVPEHFASEARRIIGPLLQDLKTGRIYENPSEIDPLLWERLRQADPWAIARSADVQVDGERGGYIVPFLNDRFLCSPEREVIEPLSTGTPHHLDFEFYLAMLHYLLEARAEGLSGQWVSEKDIPGGETFFRGPHQFPVEALLRRFGSSGERFSRAAERLGATPVEMGDRAFRFWPFPRVPMLFILWEGDEEFKPALHIRFDRSITRQLHTLDTVWALVNTVSRSLRAAAPEEGEER